MNIRQIRDTEISEIGKWFMNKKWPFPAKDSVGPDTVFIAEKEPGKMLACVGIYFTGRARAFLDLMATDPAEEYSATMPALSVLIKTVQDYLSNIQPAITVISYYTSNEKLAERLKDLNFRKEKGYFRLTWTRKSG